MSQLKLDWDHPSPSRPSAATSTSTRDEAASSGVCAVAFMTSAEVLPADEWTPFATVGNAALYVGNCLDWLDDQPPNSIHGVVTDPPYGLVEYTAQQQHKLRRGQGGVWRLPPAFDGHQRSPLPRFTTLTDDELDALGSFFRAWTEALLPVLVPGAHVLVASNPLVSHLVASAICAAGLVDEDTEPLVASAMGVDRTALLQCGLDLDPFGATLDGVVLVYALDHEVRMSVVVPVLDQ